MHWLHYLLHRREALQWLLLLVHVDEWRWRLLRLMLLLLLWLRLLVMVLLCHIWVLRRLGHFVGRSKVCREVAVDPLLGASFAGLLLLTLQMQASTGFAGLRDTTMLDDSWF